MRVVTSATGEGATGVPEQAVDVVTADLGRDVRAAASARRLTRDTLARWCVSSRVDDVLVVVSELVTNAVRHGRPPVRLVLRRTPASLQVAVRDGAPDLPPPARSAPAAAEGGRGLAIVEALADRVRCAPGGPSGKTVVASFGLPRG